MGHANFLGRAKTAVAVVNLALTKRGLAYIVGRPLTVARFQIGAFYTSARPGY